MEDYSSIIEALVFKLERANQIELKQKFLLNSFSETRNTLILVNKGFLYVGEQQLRVMPEDLLFIPENIQVPLTFGRKSAHMQVLTPEAITARRDEFLTNLPYHFAGNKGYLLNMTTLTFEARAYDVVNFFGVVSLGWFIIPATSGLGVIVRQIYDEVNQKLTSRDQMLANLLSIAVIYILRHLEKSGLFLEKLVNKRSYFKDRRILEIFKYIDANIGGNLSNKVLSEVCGVSEEYFSHYFKSVAGMAPQDFVEYQRMERAVSMLKSTKKKISQIAKELGYQDTSYFCRRFKKVHGVNAVTIRKRDKLL